MSYFRMSEKWTAIPIAIGRPTSADVYPAFLLVSKELKGCKNRY